MNEKRVFEVDFRLYSDITAVAEAIYSARNDIAVDIKLEGLDDKIYVMSDNSRDVLWFYITSSENSIWYDTSIEDPTNTKPSDIILVLMSLVTRIAAKETSIRKGMEV